MKHEARVCGIARRAALQRIFATLFLAPILALFPDRLVAQSEMKRQPVESSVLASVGYDASKRLLEIEFHSGAIYRYSEVPAEIHTRLLAAESKGHFFGAAIREKFRSERVRPRTEK